MSKGHLLTDGKWQFFQAGDWVYRASVDAYNDVTTGYAVGARDFCPIWQWQQRQETGVYPFEQRALA